MVVARLTTALWISACTFRANREGIAFTVVYKGDATAGAVLVKLNRREAGCIVLAETRDIADQRAWFHGTGNAPVSEEVADAYIERSRKRDSDLWVIEIDGRNSPIPFDEWILDI